MPKDHEDLDVKLMRNDGAQKFNLKCETVETNIGNNLIARAILSTVGDLVGADPVLNSETYQLVNVQIRNVNDGDFPSGLSSRPSGRSTEDHMESALRHAAIEWGPDTGGGFDKLVWNDEEIGVVITSFNSQESAVDGIPGQYTVNLELTHIDFYVGQE